MKKSISIILALIMIVCTLSVMVSAAPTQPAAPANGGEVAFVNGALGEAGIFTLSTGTTQITGQASGDKTMYKITCLENGEMNMFFGTDATADATGMDYLEFFLDITEVEATEVWYFVARLNDTKGQDMWTSNAKANLTYKLYSNGEWSEDKTVDDYGRVAIPAGFSGYVRFNLAQFAASYTGGAALNTAFINQFIVWWGDPIGVGNSVYFNDFKFVKEGEPAPTPASSEEASQPAGDATNSGTDAGTNNGDTGSALVSVVAVMTAVAATGVVVSKKKKR